MRVHLLPIALATCLAGAAPALAAPSATASELRDGSHDMDFQNGSWRTDITIIKDPFNKPSEVVHMKGTKVARPVWGGKAWLEEIEADGPSGHWQGANFFLYDPNAQEWSENYVDSSEGHMDSKPGIGGFRQGNLEFYSQQNVGGNTVLVRGVWKDFTPNSHTYEIARSKDGGRSWHTSFIARVTRAQ